MVRIANRKQEHLVLGGLGMRVDIGYAREYMEAAQTLMKLDETNDFVISSGRHYTIENLVTQALLDADINRSVSDVVKIDRAFIRPGPQPTLIGNHDRASITFGFNPKYDACSVMTMLIKQAQLRESL